MPLETLIDGPIKVAFDPETSEITTEAQIACESCGQFGVYLDDNICQRCLTAHLFPE